MVRRIPTSIFGILLIAGTAAADPVPVAGITQLSDGTLLAVDREGNWSRRGRDDPAWVRAGNIFGACVCGKGPVVALANAGAAADGPVALTADGRWLRLHAAAALWEDMGRIGDEAGRQADCLFVDLDAAGGTLVAVTLKGEQYERRPAGPWRYVSRPAEPAASARCDTFVAFVEVLGSEHGAELSMGGMANTSIGPFFAFGAHSYRPHMRLHCSLGLRADIRVRRYVLRPYALMMLTTFVYSPEENGDAEDNDLSNMSAGIQIERLFSRSLGIGIDVRGTRYAEPRLPSVLFVGLMVLVRGPTG